MPNRKETIFVIVSGLKTKFQENFERWGWVLIKTPLLFPFLLR